MKAPAWLDSNGPDSDVVISTRVRLARNLAGYHFPGRASLFEKKSVFDKAASAVTTLPSLSNRPCLNFLETPHGDQRVLLENHVVSEQLLAAEGDRGVIHDDTCRLSVMINETDHVRLQWLDSGYRPMELWREINRFDDELSTTLSFAFDSRRGFLTSNPNDTGTGLRVSCLMHLPGLVLTKTVDQVLLGASQTGVATSGFFRDRPVVIGNLFLLSNQAALGVTEQECIANTEEIVCKVIECERAARTKIVTMASTELADKVWRAWGVLCFARTLTMDEFLNLSSALRLGCDCMIFDRIQRDAINQLIIACQSEHLRQASGADLSPADIDIFRAETVRRLIHA
jgi:protein arginine kinase